MRSLARPPPATNIPPNKRGFLVLSAPPLIAKHSPLQNLFLHPFCRSSDCWELGSYSFDQRAFWRETRNDLQLSGDTLWG